MEQRRNRIAVVGAALAGRGRAIFRYPHHAGKLVVAASGRAPHPGAGASIANSLWRRSIPHGMAPTAPPSGWPPNFMCSLPKWTGKPALIRYVTEYLLPRRAVALGLQPSAFLRLRGQRTYGADRGHPHRPGGKGRGADGGASGSRRNAGADQPARQARDGI